MKKKILLYGCRLLCLLVMVMLYPSLSIAQAPTKTTKEDIEKARASTKASIDYLDAQIELLKKTDYSRGKESAIRALRNQRSFLENRNVGGELLKIDEAIAKLGTPSGRFAAQAQGEINRLQAKRQNIINTGFEDPSAEIKTQAAATAAAKQTALTKGGTSTLTKGGTSSALKEIKSDAQAPTKTTKEDIEKARASAKASMDYLDAQIESLNKTQNSRGKAITIQALRNQRSFLENRNVGGELIKIDEAIAKLGTPSGRFAAQAQGEINRLQAKRQNIINTGFEDPSAEIKTQAAATAAAKQTALTKGGTSTLTKGGTSSALK
ncbi:MAG: hypothetical protein INF44_05245, partial [Thalassospira sp.]|nr:hypothetical protein [Thalassospira sp.]